MKPYRLNINNSKRFISVVEIFIYVCISYVKAAHSVSVANVQRKADTHKHTAP